LSGSNDSRTTRRTRVSAATRAGDIKPQKRHATLFDALLCPAEASQAVRESAELAALPVAARRSADAIPTHLGADLRAFDQAMDA
jgi:hypothetical protein